MACLPLSAQHPHGEFEDLAAIHVGELLHWAATRQMIGDAADIQTVGPRRIRAQHEGFKTVASGHFLDDHRAAAVAKQHGDAPVTLIHDLGQHLSAHHKHLFWPCQT